MWLLRRFRQHMWWCWRRRAVSLSGAGDGTAAACAACQQLPTTAASLVPVTQQRLVGSDAQRSVTIGHLVPCRASHFIRHLCFCGSLCHKSNGRPRQCWSLRLPALSPLVYHTNNNHGTWSLRSTMSISDSDRRTISFFGTLPRDQLIPKLWRV